MIMICISLIINDVKCLFLCLLDICVEIAIFFFFFKFLGLHLQHVEGPRLGVKLELKLLAYVTATSTQDRSRGVSYLQHSSQQCWMLNPTE